MKNVLVAGATGYLGRFIANELAEQSYAGRLIVRNSAKAEFDSNKHEVVKANVTDASSLTGCCDEVDVVISTVGITKQKDGFTYMDVDYNANLNILNEAKRSGVKKFIFVSAFKADSLTHLKLCNAKEKFVEEIQNSGMEYCIIRPTGFFSDMTEFLKMAKKGTVNLFDDGNFKMNPIHGADLAKVCVEAIESEDKTIEVGGPEVFTHNQIAEIAFKVIKKKPKIRYIPEWMRKTILGITRTFTSSKAYGPIEFFFTVLAMDMIAPTHGKHTLEKYFLEVSKMKQKVQ